MRTPPEAFLIFREELKKIQKQKSQLQEQYQHEVDELTDEISFLKEQISSQRTMMQMAVDHAKRLESELKTIKKTLSTPKPE
ncbi:hypothetical protein AB9P05_22670 [Roseivirga sp. BDSF3-8]|uniref:hypothetical protein n=1 Tax=Roseivirga sp. BDSF3-8 TaxID=3241598 RepID=UPI003531CA33